MYEILVHGSCLFQPHFFTRLHLKKDEKYLHPLIGNRNLAYSKFEYAHIRVSQRPPIVRRKNAELSAPRRGKYVMIKDSIVVIKLILSFL
jgi:hypothetical protein